MEKIEVDNKDRPIEDIIIQDVQVFVDPYEEADEKLKEERATEAARAAEEAAKEKAKAKKRVQTVYRTGVTKYIDPKYMKAKYVSFIASENTNCFQFQNVQK